MMRAWARRAAGLHRELGQIAELRHDPRWWLVAGGAALPWERRSTYVISDAEPESDTFIGTPSPDSADPIREALAGAHAARDAIRALDGQLPDQPLAVTVRRTAIGAVAAPSLLDVVAFAIGDRAWCATLGPAFDDARDRAIAADLARVLAGQSPQLLQPPGTLATPFVAISLGDEPIDSARHGHRRAWLGNGTGSGPWLGLGHAGGLAVVSTCHMIVDGFGHTWLASEIWTRIAALLDVWDSAVHVRDSGVRGTDVRGSDTRGSDAHVRGSDARGSRLPALSTVAGASPLAIAWRELSGPTPDALGLAYALGRILHRVAGRPDARFSPTFQIPVAPGHHDDGERRKRRIVPAIASVRFDRGRPDAREPEAFETFAARTRELLHREADGTGPAAFLLAAARGAPAPLAWKRRAVGPTRPGWLEPVASVIGGRGCVSRIRVDLPGGTDVPPVCAVSSPARLPTVHDPLGGCVVTVVDDGRRAAITVCGAGFLHSPARAAAILAEVLDLTRR